MSTIKRKDNNGNTADALRTIADLIDIAEKEHANVQIKIDPEFLREVAAQLDVLTAMFQTQGSDFEKIWKNNQKLKDNFFNTWLKYKDPEE